MTNRQTGILAAVFCATGLVSAGALAYDLGTPPSVPPRLELSDPPRLTASANQLEAVRPDPLTLQLEAVVIVAERPRAVPVAAPKPRDIDDMACTDWRPLEQGSVTQKVRLCE